MQILLLFFCPIKYIKSLHQNTTTKTKGKKPVRSSTNIEHPLDPFFFLFSHRQY